MHFPALRQNLIELFVILVACRHAAAQIFQAQELLQRFDQPRRLQQDDNKDAVTVVTTAEEFTAAIKAPAAHIEVRQHLDLTGWSYTFSASHPGGSSSFELPTEVQSIRGNCSQPYPQQNAFDTDSTDYMSLPQKPNQCQLLFSCTSREKYCPWFHFFITDPSRINQDGKPLTEPVWLDNLSIRAMGGGGSSVVTYRDLWMTNVTMQWSNPHTSMWPGPLWAVGDVHVEDSIIAGWSPSVGPVFVAMAPTSIVNTTFLDNYIQPALMKEYGLITSYDGAPVKYQNVTFENNDSHYTLFNNTFDRDSSMEDQTFFGDPQIRVGLTGGDFILSSPLKSAPDEFLQLQDPRLKRIKQIVSTGSAIRPDVTILDSSNFPLDQQGSDSWLMRRAPTGIYVGFLFILYTGVALCVARRRHRRVQAAQSEVSIEPRDERDITETEHMLALVGVAQPASVYRLDVHRWTVTPLANKLLPSDSSSAPSNGTIPSNGNSGVVDEDPAEPGEGLKISNSANRVPSQENQPGEVELPELRTSLESADVDTVASGNPGSAAGEAGPSPKVHTAASEAPTHNMPQQAGPGRPLSPLYSTTFQPGNASTGPFHSASSAENQSESQAEETSTAASQGGNQTVPSVGATPASSAPELHGNVLTAACKDESSSMDTADMCVICYENTGDRVMLPCGHGGYCSVCARRLFLRPPMLCPICRETLTGVIKVSLDTPIGGEHQYPTSS